MKITIKTLLPDGTTNTQVFDSDAIFDVIVDGFSLSESEDGLVIRGKRTLQIMPKAGNSIVVKEYK